MICMMKTTRPKERSIDQQIAKISLFTFVAQIIATIIQLTIFAITQSFMYCVLAIMFAVVAAGTMYANYDKIRKTFYKKK